MTRGKWPVVVLVALCLVVAAVATAYAAGEVAKPPVEPAVAGRPAELVKPAPAVNPKAVVWRTLDAPKDAQAGDVWVNPIDGGEMVYVSAGPFLMGSGKRDGAARDDEKPQFRATLPGYWIDRCEVTVAQFWKFCDATGRKMPPSPVWGWQGEAYRWGREDNRPIVYVSWGDAAAYAEWAGKRLPTEMEWEKAARGTDGRIYPWGNKWQASRCAGPPSKAEGTKPVGSHPLGASPYGAMDMAGNVEEWCEDWYDVTAYARYAKGDLTSPARGESKVLRGMETVHEHMTDEEPWSVRCAARDSWSPDQCAGSAIGFRCVRDAAQ